MIKMLIIVMPSQSCYDVVKDINDNYKVDVGDSDVLELPRDPSSVLPVLEKYTHVFLIGRGVAKGFGLTWNFFTAEEGVMLLPPPGNFGWWRKHPIAQRMVQEFIKTP